MRSDLVNGLFEAIGALFVWINIRTIWKDKGYKGVHWLPAIFFNSWGVWNLYFYPHLHQWWSFSGGLFMVITNTIWVGLMFKFGRKD